MGHYSVVGTTQKVAFHHFRKPSFKINLSKLRKMRDAPDRIL
jgi:hypothetical protein